MGCPEFYEEFLTTWLSLLVEAGFKNPAIYAVEYTLVPQARHPKQANEILLGYRHAVRLADDVMSRVVVSGDSAGACLALGLIASIGWNRSPKEGVVPRFERYVQLSAPFMAVLISPWVNLYSWRDRNTAGDFLDVDTLQEYAVDYMAHAQPPALMNVDGANKAVARGHWAAAALDGVGPGLCQEPTIWPNGCRRMFITYGTEEVFAATIREFFEYLDAKTTLQTNRMAQSGMPHAWPVASLFLSDGDRRLEGLRAIVAEMKECCGHA